MIISKSRRVPILLTATAACAVAVGGSIFAASHHAATDPIPITDRTPAPYFQPLPAGTVPFFEDRAAKSGIDFALGHFGKSPLTVLDEMGTGCAICDFDGDGHADILLIGELHTPTNGECRLYHNNGNGTFTDVTKGSGLEAPGMYMGCAVADVDNDGRPDIVLTGFGVVRLLRNLGHMKFEDITAASGLAAKSPSAWATAAAFADVDRDGLVDLYIGRYVVFDDKVMPYCMFGNLLSSCGPVYYDPQVGSMYKNMGHGHFKDVTHAWGLDTVHGKCLGAAFADVNGDGWPDLYLANDEMAGDLFVNDHGKGFRNVGVESGVAYSGNGTLQGGMGVDWGDYDHDGLPDLFVSTFEFEPKAIYRNTGDAHFRIMGDETGIGRPTKPYVAFGCKFLDVRNNGWLDIAIANGHIHDNEELLDKFGRYRQPMQLFLNEQGTTYLDKTREAGRGFCTPAVGRGLAVGDLNDDGLEDILMVDAEGPARLLMNQCPNPGNWLRVTLHGTTSNSMGIGARVTVVAGTQKWIREATTGGSYLSASDPRVHFGLGPITAVDRVLIDWPSGKHSTVQSPHVPGDIQVTEP